MPRHQIAVAVDPQVGAGPEPVVIDSRDPFGILSEGEPAQARGCQLGIRATGPGGLGQRRIAPLRLQQRVEAGETGAPGRLLRVGRGAPVDREGARPAVLPGEAGLGRAGDRRPRIVLGPVDVLGPGVERAVHAERPVGIGASADPVPRLDEGEALARRAQRGRGRETRRTGADDHHGPAPRGRAQGRRGQQGGGDDRASGGCRLSRPHGASARKRPGSTGRGRTRYPRAPCVPERFSIIVLTCISWSQTCPGDVPKKLKPALMPQ